MDCDISVQLSPLADFWLHGKACYIYIYISLSLSLSLSLPILKHMHQMAFQVGSEADGLLPLMLSRGLGAGLALDVALQPQRAKRSTRGLRSPVLDRIPKRPGAFSASGAFFACDIY